MSLRAIDMDADGDADVLYSDRKQMTRGVKWLENTGKAGDASGLCTRSAGLTSK